MAGSDWVPTANEQPPPNALLEDEPASPSSSAISGSLIGATMTVLSCPQFEI